LVEHWIFVTETVHDSIDNSVSLDFLIKELTGLVLRDR
jgi:hypothetical protein